MKRKREDSNRRHEGRTKETRNISVKDTSAREKEKVRWDDEKERVRDAFSLISFSRMSTCQTRRTNGRYRMRARGRESSDAFVLARR